MMNRYKIALGEHTLLRRAHEFAVKAIRKMRLEGDGRPLQGRSEDFKTVTRAIPVHNNFFGQPGMVRWEAERAHETMIRAGVDPKTIKIRVEKDTDMCAITISMRGLKARRMPEPVYRKDWLVEELSEGVLPNV